MVKTIKDVGFSKPIARILSPSLHPEQLYALSIGTSAEMHFSNAVS